MRATQLLPLFLAAAAAADIPKAEREARKDPVQTVVLAHEQLKDLKKPQTADFIRTYASPEDLKKMPGTVEEIAPAFYDRKRPELLNALAAAREVSPTLSDGGTRATFVFKEPVNTENLAAGSGIPKRSREISFSKVGEYWYLVN